MECRFCGVKLPENAQFCWKCGIQQSSVQTNKYDNLMARADDILLTKQQIQALFDDYSYSYKAVPKETTEIILRTLRPLFKTTNQPIMELYQYLRQLA